MNCHRRGEGIESGKNYYPIGVGLKVKTVLGIEFEVKGAVVMKIIGGKRVYFCDGAAYPEDFVDEVITTHGNGLKT